MGAKAKLCVHCGTSKCQHIKALLGHDQYARAKVTKFKKLTCLDGKNSFKLAPTTFDPEVKPDNPPENFLPRDPVEMVAGKWTRQNRCPVCIQFLPPFFVTAGLKENRGHVKEVACNNCRSKIGKPDEWKQGQALNIKFNAPEALAKLKETVKQDAKDQSKNPDSV